MNNPKILHTRLFIAAGILLIVPFAVGVQLFRLHWSAGEGLRNLWAQQAVEMQEIPAQRGSIYDVNGRLLATNSVIYTAAIDPGYQKYSDELADTVATILASALEQSKSYYLNRIKKAKESGSRYVILDKRVPHSVYMMLKSLNERAVILDKQFSRVYIFNELAAHVLGYVNFNMDGMIGLEAQFNKALKGKSGLQQVRRNRLNKTYEYIGAPKELPVNGQNVYTTLNIDLQSIAETELRRGVEKTKSKAGVAILMDIRSGAVRAMSSWPTFDPNKPASMSEENRRNYAISDMMEPGSTFKLVTAVAALDQGVIKEGEIFETPESGRTTIHNLAMVDHDPLGNLRFDEVIAKSSNIATSEIAMRIPKNHFYQYARNLGFGMKTDIELPTESSGMLKKPMEWSQVTQPFMSIGYEILATPLQIAQAYAAFANNGVLMKPHIVDHLEDEYGQTTDKVSYTRVRQAIDEDIVEQLRPIFKQVVSDSGTASWAQIEGVEVAGKTGTAKMVKNGRYARAYRASFAGFFPADNPVYVCYVMLEEPRTSIYGGYAAGPVFRRIAERVAAHEGYTNGWLQDENRLAETNKIPTPKWSGRTLDEVYTLSEIYDLDVDIDGDEYKTAIVELKTATDSVLIGDELLLKTTPLAIKSDEADLIQVPEVRGLSMRQAARKILASGLKPNFERSGTVYNQFPLPGQKMRKGHTVLIRGKAKDMGQLSVAGGTNE